MVALILGLDAALCSLPCGAAPEQALPQPTAANAAPEEPSAMALALRARYPIPDAVILPFQYNANYGFGPNEVTRNVLNIQPLLPVTLSEEWRLIVRPVVPIIWYAAPAPGIESAAGLGDSNVQFYFTQRRAGKWTWGLGPVILLPTATEKNLGSGKWGFGPAALFAKRDGPWLYGGLIGNVWSVGHNDRPDVNFFSFQPLVTYTIPKGKGWYFTSNPYLTANWEAPGSDVWTVPIGAGFGRVFRGRPGSPATDVSLQGYYNVERPSAGPTWQVRFVMQFLFPEGL